MGLFDRFAKKAYADWPAAGVGRPKLSLAARAVGPLALGDPLEKARVFGRPARAKRITADTEQLDYEGFDLHFSGGKLDCATFDVAQGAVEVDGHPLTPATTPLDVQVWFGDPTSDGSEHGLRWIDYERGEATLALEFEDGRLGTVQLYGPGYA